MSAPRLMSNISSGSSSYWSGSRRYTTQESLSTVSRSISIRRRCTPSHPRGRSRRCPRRATPVDFAYGIHTDVGHTCVGARVNGRMVPLRTQLVSGDIVGGRHFGRTQAQVEIG